MEDSEKKEMIEIIKEALKPESEFVLANQPFKSGEEKEESEQYIMKPNEAKQITKELIGFKTYTFLDTMFLDREDKEIEGMPFGSNCILSGLPNSGKSLLLEEIILQVANNNKKVCYVTSEEVFRVDTSRFDLQSRLKERTEMLGLNWDIISQNLFVLDIVTFAEMRDWFSLISTYRFLVETKKIDFLAIDSLTMCEDSRGQLKYRLGQLIKYNQLHGVSSIMINQRATDKPDSFSMAGNIGISHIADIVMVLDYKQLSSWDKTIKLDTDSKQMELVYFFHVLKCRMSKYKASYFKYSITSDGLVRLQPKIEEDSP